MDTQGQKAKLFALDAADIKSIRVTVVLLLMFALLVFSLVIIGASSYVVWKAITSLAC